MIKHCRECHRVEGDYHNLQCKLRSESNMFVTECQCEAASKSISLSPGSIGLASMLMSLFDENCVEVGIWLEPCKVHEVSDEDIKALRDLLPEININIIN